MFLYHRVQSNFATSIFSPPLMQVSVPFTLPRLIFCLPPCCAHFLDLWVKVGRAFIFFSSCCSIHVTGVLSLWSSPSWHCPIAWTYAIGAKLIFFLLIFFFVIFFLLVVSSSLSFLHSSQTFHWFWLPSSFSLSKRQFIQNHLFAQKALHDLNAISLGTYLYSLLNSLCFDSLWILSGFPFGLSSVARGFPSVTQIFQSVSRALTQICFYRLSQTCSFEAPISLGPF